MGYVHKLLAAAAAVLATGCGSSGPTEVVAVPYEIRVTPQSLSMIRDSTHELGVVVLDAAGAPIPTAPLVFSTSDSNVARVSASGRVSAVGAGTATLTVRSAPASASIVVVVTNPVPPASIEISPSTAVLPGSVQVQLTAVARDSAGDVIDGAPITFSSRAPTIVSVSATGLVSRVGVGTTYVIATSGPVSDSALVTAVIERLSVGGFPFGVAVSAAGVGFVTRASVNAVARFDLPSPVMTGSVAAGSFPTSVAFSLTGDRAYVGNQFDASVHVIDVAAGADVDSARINGTVLAVATSGDTLLVVGTDAGQVYVVELPSLALIDSVAVPGYVNAMALRGWLLYASSPTVGVVTEIDLAARQVARSLPVGGTPQGLAVSTDGNSLYVANESGNLEIWNLVANTLVANVPLAGGGGFGLARNPANGLLYVSTSYFGRRVHVIDPITRTVVRVIMTGGVPRRIGFAPSGNVGIVANEDGWVDFIN